MEYNTVRIPRVIVQKIEEEPVKMVFIGMFQNL